MSETAYAVPQPIALEQPIHSGLNFGRVRACISRVGNVLAVYGTDFAVMAISPKYASGRFMLLLDRDPEQARENAQAYGFVRQAGSIALGLGIYTGNSYLRTKSIQSTASDRSSRQNDSVSRLERYLKLRLYLASTR